jgi:glutamate synthase (ferredoxin)
MWGAERDACGTGFLADVEGRPRADLLPLALIALRRLAHRGGVDADGRTGDGAGVTTQVPHALLQPELEARGLGLLPLQRLAVGALFLPRSAEPARRGREILAQCLSRQDLDLLGFRDVPIREEALGETALRSRPEIVHALVARPAGLAADEFERRLYAARREAEAQARSERLEDFYVVSLSHRSLVYKALARAVDLADFYPDLRQADFATSFVLFHQRFSTNTVPCWAMTQPFRLLAHNGEINTIQGNRSWMRAREPGLQPPRLRLPAAALRPVLPEGTSDSASLDEALALVATSGRSLLQGITLLIPPAWEADLDMPAGVRAMFEDQASVMEPWDGPAMVVFTDGRVVGAALDRNGLRPARTLVTVDGLVLVGSEAGLLDVREERVLSRDRLGPGDVVAVDLEARRFLDREAIHRHLAALHAGHRRSRKRPVPLESLRASDADSGASPSADARVLRAFGYTREEMLLILGPMYKEGLEPLGSMGDDTPLAVLSSRPRMLFSYFKQRFAQVTNPAIDPLREAVVMSLATHLGLRGELLGPAGVDAPRLGLSDPLLDPADVAALDAWDETGWRVERLSLLFPSRDGAAGFAVALEDLLAAAEDAVRQGATLLVLSDRGVDARWAALPSLLAVSAVHQHLVRRGLRLQASLLAEAGDARDDHHVAALIGFGADAVSPYLALETIADAVGRAGGDASDFEAARARYRKALLKGLLKILAKMGVSTIRSYHGAQLFEAVGIGEALVERHFTGTPSPVGGVGLDEIAGDVIARHRAAWAAPDPELEEGGLHRYRRNGEAHAFEPPVVKALHEAIRTGERLDYRRYADLVHARPPIALRDLLEFREQAAIPVSEVEPVESILPRFMTAAMSLGALSPEAQQVLAIAMNRMGAKSNSGEGGEPAELYWKVLPGGDRVRNRVKQVASGRFGVTAEYLMAADELQIKMAQGSKPGEGGQLPGHKVAPHIARVRHAAPGITLISPPPHHDIYSIEDLAQLIYDLKRVNPAAAVSVKLVSSAGIGTIAAGVAKAHADAIQVSGHDGGTGASPLSSIKNAGTPWEVGLADVQQALVRGGLRGRVRLQVDGGFKTGRDVVIAAMLGAEEFGFGTAALVAAGCVMARQCHLNTCPAGIATQREELRQRFTGRPEDVVRFFTSVAEEVREVLALLGVRRLEEVVGRADLLEVRPTTGKPATVRLDRVLETALGRERRWAGETNDPPHTGGSLDEVVLQRLRFGAGGVMPLKIEVPVTNGDRAVGARVAGELARRFHGRPVPAGRIQVRYRGSAGQSFGAFCVEGLRLVLEGDANDYVGKGMSGGEIVLRPRRRDRTRAAVIAGNTCLYGATGGRAFFAGRAGERFAVRNSGAVAVVEGTGDHACEYMTAGVVVILGPTGRNLGAGMSGGLAFVLDEEGALGRRYNPELVTLDDTISFEEEEWLRRLIALHCEATRSRRGREILAGWSDYRGLMRRVIPRAGSVPVALPMLAAADEPQTVASSYR